MSKYFTPEIAEATKKWMETNDHELYNTIVHPALLNMVEYQLNRFPSYYIIDRDRNYVRDVVMTHIYLVINNYDPAKAQIHTYIQQVIINKLCNLLKHHQYYKRDSSKICSMESYITNQDGEETDTMIEFAAPMQEYNMYQDPEFINYVVTYWNNKIEEGSVTQGKKRFIRLVLDILINPNQVPHKTHITKYMINKLGITRQAIQQYILYMQSYSDIIMNGYNRETLLHKVLK